MPFSKLFGWIALLYAATAAFTGALVAWHYVPSLDLAQASLFDLHETVRFGGTLRSVHHWSGHLSLIFALLHFAFALRWKRDTEPRRATWVTGLAAVALLVTLAFLGRLLPWDEHGAVSWVVARAFFGLPSPAALPGSAHTLMRVWLLHMIGAATLTVCVALHFSWRVALRERGFARETLPIVAAVAVAALVVLAMASPVSLHGPFLGFTSSTTATAEWYLRWLQFLAERSVLLARVALLSLAGLSALSALARTRVQQRGCRWAWAAVLAGLAVLSAMPVGPPEGP